MTGKSSSGEAVSVPVSQERRKFLKLIWKLKPYAKYAFYAALGAG